MLGQPTLSVAIITFNEEKNIKDCIESVLDIADEVIVLDSFSKDRTQSICAEFPCVKFSQHAFDGHVNQKNRALELCIGKWILCLDADERVTVELRKSIQRFLETNQDAIAAKFPRLTFHMNKYIRHGGWYPNARYRLIKKGCAYWGGENPHDVLIINGKGENLTGNLIHYSFIDLADQMDTNNKFSTIMAYTRFHKGRKFHLTRLLLKPISKFIGLYFLKRGFLDGMQGFIIGISAAYSTFATEAKLYELDKLNLERPSNLPETYAKQVK